MAANQPTPEQVAALQQTNQFGGMTGTDPAMSAQQLPPGAGASAPEPAITADQAQQATLGLILKIASRTDLDIDVQTTGINTLATAFKSLSDSQQAQPDPQVQQQIDVAKAQQEMQNKQQESDMNLAVKQHEMMLREQAHNNEQRRLDESHKASILMQAQQQKHQQGINEQKMSNDHEIAQSKVAQAPKPAGK